MFGRARRVDVLFTTWQLLGPLGDQCYRLASAARACAARYQPTSSGPCYAELIGAGTSSLAMLSQCWFIFILVGDCLDVKSKCTLVFLVELLFRNQDIYRNPLLSRACEANMYLLVLSLVLLAELTVARSLASAVHRRSNPAGFSEMTQYEHEPGRRRPSDQQQRPSQLRTDNVLMTTPPPNRLATTTVPKPSMKGLMEIAHTNLRSMKQMNFPDKDVDQYQKMMRDPAKYRDEAVAQARAKRYQEKSQDLTTAHGRLAHVSSDKG